MITAWTKHLTNPEEKEQYAKSLSNSKWILDHLSDLLTKVETDVTRQEISPRAYDNANWPYRQAHSNGFKQAIRVVKQLISLDLKEQHDQSIRAGERPIAS